MALHITINKPSTSPGPPPANPLQPGDVYLELTTATITFAEVAGIELPGATIVAFGLPIFGAVSEYYNNPQNYGEAAAIFTLGSSAELIAAAIAGAVGLSAAGVAAAAAIAGLSAIGLLKYAYQNNAFGIDWEATTEQFLNGVEQTIKDDAGALQAGISDASSYATGLISSFISGLTGDAQQNPSDSGLAQAASLFGANQNSILSTELSAVSAFVSAGSGDTTDYDITLPSSADPFAFSVSYTDASASDIAPVGTLVQQEPVSNGTLSEVLTSTTTGGSAAPGEETQTYGSTGAPVSIDVENPDRTSELTTYNPDGSSTTTTYSGPNGTGSIISVTSTSTTIAVQRTGAVYSYLNSFSNGELLEGFTTLAPIANANLGTPLGLPVSIGIAGPGQQTVVGGGTFQFTNGNISQWTVNVTNVINTSGGTETISSNSTSGDSVSRLGVVVASSSHPGTWTFFQYDIIATVSPVAGQTQELSDVLSTVTPQGNLLALSINGPGAVTVTGVISAPSVRILTIDNGGDLVLQGGALNVGPPLGQDPLTISAGGKLSGYGSLTALGALVGSPGEITNNGMITANGGALDINANVIGTGSLTFGPDPTLTLEGTVAATQSVIFNGPNQNLLLGAHSNVMAPVSGFAAGDSIALEGQQITSALYDPGTGMLAIVGSTGPAFDLKMVGTYQQNDFNTAGGNIVFTTATPPVITGSTPNTVEKSQATVIATVKPGTAGDTLTLKETAGTGTLSLGTAQADGSQQVIYTAPASVPASTNDAVAYTVTGNGIAATGATSVQLDAGPTITAAIPTPVGQTKTTTIGTVTPGLAGDTLTVKETAGLGTLSLGTVQANGTQQVIYTAPATVPVNTIDTVAYTISDQHNDATATAVPETVQLVGASLPPAIQAPAKATVTVGQNSPVAGISISETSAAPGETFTVVLADTNDVLSATTSATGGGGTITPSNGGKTLTIGGSLAQVNADLTTLTDNDASTSADTITVNAKDSFGNVAPSKSITVTVNGLPDAGPSIILLPFTPGNANKAITIATATPGLPTDTLSLVVTQAPSSGTVKLNGSSVQYTPAAGPSKLMSFSFQIKDQFGDVTPTATIITGGELANNITGNKAGNTDIGLGNGLNKITLAANGNVVNAGNGADLISGGASNNTIILGNGLDSVTLSGGNNKVTLGNGADAVTVGGSGNQIKLGSGLDLVHGGTADTITLIGNGGGLTLFGKSEMVFLNGSGKIIDDRSQGMKLELSGSPGNVTLTDFAKDTTGAIDLLGGLGNFKTPQAVVTALQTDHHGGTTLSFGKAGSIDFVGVAVSQLHASNFQIG